MTVDRSFGSEGNAPVKCEDAQEKTQARACGISKFYCGAGEGLWLCSSGCWVTAALRERRKGQLWKGGSSTLDAAFRWSPLVTDRHRPPRGGQQSEVGSSTARPSSRAQARAPSARRGPLRGVQSLRAPPRSQTHQPCAAGNYSSRQAPRGPRAPAPRPPASRRDGREGRRKGRGRRGGRVRARRVKPRWLLLRDADAGARRLPPGQPSPPL